MQHSKLVMSGMNTKCYVTVGWTWGRASVAEIVLLQQFSETHFWGYELT